MPPARPYPPCRGRVHLVLEELECREVLSPVVAPPVFFPGPPQTPEAVSIGFGGNGSAFGVSDPADTGNPYTADLIATRGVLSVDAGVAGEFGVSVANNDSSRVTVTGPLAQIDSFLRNAGYTYTPDAFFSGEATLALSVPDPAGLADGYAEHVVQVLPVVQPPIASVNVTPAFFGPGPLALPPNSVGVGPWADADGSETVSVAIGLMGGDPTQFTLTAGGAPVPLDPDFLWVITAADAATLQPLLDALVLTPPAGFTGPFALDFTIIAEDYAAYPSTGDEAADGAVLDMRSVPFRAFAGGAAVTASPLLTSEGQPLDLGGLLSATDPDDGPGDEHAVTLSAPLGVFVFDPAVGSFAAGVSGTGTNTLTVSGSLADIAAVLGTPGALTFDPPPDFSGELPLVVSFEHERPAFGPRGQGPPTAPYPAPTGLVLPLRVTPVASVPGAFQTFETPPLVPIGPTASPVPAGLFQLFDPPDADGSESLAVVVNVVGGATPGFVLTAGGSVIPRQPDGSWLLLGPDAASLQSLLDTLTVTPAGGLTGLGFALEFTLVVTDSAAYPSDGTTGLDVSSRPLTPVPLRLFAGGLQVGVSGVVVGEGQPADLGNGAIGLADPDGQPGDTYRVTLQLGDGAFALFDPAGLPSTVSATGFGTATLTLDGDPAGLAALFASAGVFGFTPPTGTFSGLISLGATVTAFRDGVPQDGAPGGAAAVVLPVASAAGVVARGSAEVFAPSAPFAPGAGFFTVFSWPDADASEAGVIELSLPGGDDFELAVNGVPLTPVGPGRWVIAGASAAELGAQLDALTLTPPAGFTGRVTLVAALTLTDSAPSIPASSTSTASAATPLRFFAEGIAVGPAQVTGPEGAPLPLGGVLTALDPNDLPGDRHVLTLAVPGGTLVADPAALPATVTLLAPDAATVILDGPLADIAAFLASPGSLTFDPQDATFVGSVPLAFELAFQVPVPVRGNGPPSSYSPPSAVGAIELVFAALPEEPTPPPTPTDEPPPVEPPPPETDDPEPPAPVVFTDDPEPSAPVEDDDDAASQLPLEDFDDAESFEADEDDFVDDVMDVPGGEISDDPDPVPERSRVESLISVGVVYGSAAAGAVGNETGPAESLTVQAFARAEAAPTAAVLGAERHPLPPVLPLDSSAPVAGFTDSGGDSLALLDDLLREIAPITLPIVVDVPHPARADEPAPAVATAVGPTAWAAGGDATTGGGGWPFDWLAAGLGLTAAAWLAYGRGVGRWCRRGLARLFPPTKELA